MRHHPDPLFNRGRITAVDLEADISIVCRYLVDAFTIYAASALAANTVVRSVAGAVLPLAGLPMYQTLGIGWGNSLLGFIALALLPLPFWIVAKGEWLRTKFELKDI